MLAAAVACTLSLVEARVQVTLTRRKILPRETKPTQHADVFYSCLWLGLGSCCFQHLLVSATAASSMQIAAFFYLRGYTAFTNRARTSIMFHVHAVDKVHIRFARLLLHRLAEFFCVVMLRTKGRWRDPVRRRVFLLVRLCYLFDIGRHYPVPVCRPANSRYLGG